MCQIVQSKLIVTLNKKVKTLKVKILQIAFFAFTLTISNPINSIPPYLDTFPVSSLTQISILLHLATSF